MHKRGQAAMEFLMTYGWAILAAIIAIGVLAYFGVFSPQNLAGSSGAVNAPFFLDGFNTAGTDTVNLELTQNLGETVTVAASGVTLTGTGPFSDTTCTSAASTVNFVSGNRTVVALTCSPAFSSGDSIVGDISIAYTKSGSSLQQTSTGTLRTTAQ